MLNRDNATKALSAVSGLSLEATKVANVAKATLRNKQYMSLPLSYTITLKIHTCRQNVAVL